MLLVDSRPETDDSGRDSDERAHRSSHPSEVPVLAGNSSSTLDERYIQQLKSEITVLSHLCHEKHRQSWPHTHHHIKTMYSIRETHKRSADAWLVDQHDSVREQLTRYNFSPDPDQVAIAKTKLEALLSNELTALMHLHLAVKRNLAGERLERQPNVDPWPHTSTIATGTRSSTSFGSGCGTSCAPAYANAFLGVLQRTETLEVQMLAASAEKLALTNAVAARDKRLALLSEEIEFFKDALAKSKGSSLGWATLQSNWRKAVALAEQTDAIALSAAQATANVGSAERAAKIHALETKLAALETELQMSHEDKRALSDEVESAKAQLQTSSAQLKEALTQSQTAAQTHAQELEALRTALGSQIRAAEVSLTAALAQNQQLEAAATHDKMQLRRDKHELERLLQRQDDERDARHKAEQTAANALIDTLRAELKRAEQRAAALGSDVTRLRASTETQTRVSDELRAELAQSVLQTRELELRAASATASVTEKDAALEHAQSRLDAAASDIAWHAQQLGHQQNQLELLEAKLSRSIPADTDELLRRRLGDERDWHERIAALEHALAVERQAAASVTAQCDAAVATEKERAEHAVAQCRVVAQELAVANLCLAERKTQREQERSEFNDATLLLEQRIAALTAEVDRLSEKLQTAHTDAAAAQQAAQQQLEDIAARCERECLASEVAAKRAAATELEMRSALETVTNERDALAQRVHALQRATPRSNNSASAALSETRVELQRAKQRIATLEETLAQRESRRAKDVDGKLAQLSARERKTADDHTLLKRLRSELSAEKKELQTSKQAISEDQLALAAATTAMQDEKRLVRQVIAVLVQRLRLQLELLSIVPPEAPAHTSVPLPSSTRHRSNGSNGSNGSNRLRSSHRDLNGSTLTEFLHTFPQQHAETWRRMHATWERLQQELDDADWQLVHMRHRLEELCLVDPSSAARTSRIVVSAAADGSKRDSSSTAAGSKVSAGGVTTSPFSDAIAAGKETAPIADQLNASASTRGLAMVASDDDRVSLASALAKVEEHETFALALAKEMKAMKESYEVQLQGLQLELRTAQRLRAESSQRLRTELDEERKRSQHIISQLSGKCALLENQLAELQRRLDTLQSQEIELLERYEATSASASSEASQREVQRALFALVSVAHKDELARRAVQRQDRLAKLHAYCGSSSVTVERDDKKQLQ